MTCNECTGSPNGGVGVVSGDGEFVTSILRRLNASFDIYLHTSSQFLADGVASAVFRDTPRNHLQQCALRLIVLCILILRMSQK